MLRFMGLQRVGHDWATELNIPLYIRNAYLLLYLQHSITFPLSGFITRSWSDRGNVLTGSHSQKVLEGSENGVFSGLTCGPSREVNGSLDGRVGFHILPLLCWALWRVTLWSL